MTTDSARPCRPAFDAVLILSFGGPAGPDEVRPFLANVARDRPVPPARLEEVARHYLHFGGVSPLTERTRQQAAGLQQRLRETGIDVPVHVGMRNWHPLLTDVLAEMSRAGVRRVLGFIAAAHHCYSSCGQYKEDVVRVRESLRSAGLADVDVTYVDSWYDHPQFIATLVDHTRSALDRLDPALRERARILFTAHSLPRSMAESSRYVQQLETTARRVAEGLGQRDWTLVYQSRSGRPSDPWLEPDICDYLRGTAVRGLPAAVIAPIGLLCDHIEVLWDLDIAAMGVCRERDLPVVRAETVNDDPTFIDMMGDLVRRKFERHQRFPPLPIVAG